MSRFVQVLPEGAIARVKSRWPDFEELSDAWQRTVLIEFVDDTFFEEIQELHGIGPQRFKAIFWHRQDRHQRSGRTMTSYLFWVQFLYVLWFEPELLLAEKHLTAAEALQWRGRHDAKLTLFTKSSVQELRAWAADWIDETIVREVYEELDLSQEPFFTE